MLRRKRMPIGAATAYVPVKWLNLTGGQTANQRVVKLLQTAKALVNPSSIKAEVAVDLLTWKLLRTKRQMPSAKRTRLARDLRRQLSRYKVCPEISPGRPGEWRQRWRPLIKTAQVPITVSSGGDTETYLFSEEEIVLRIVELARQGNIHRIQGCRHCRKWFFKMVRHQNYCSEKCQQCNFRGNEQFKIKRMLYMRDYRQKERERSKRAESRAEMQKGLSSVLRKAQ